jgi:hypothetical protein
LNPPIAAKAKENQGRRTDIQQISAESPRPVDTRKHLAATAGVSHDTIDKAEFIAAKASEPVKVKPIAITFSPVARVAGWP